MASGFPTHAYHSALPFSGTTRQKTSLLKVGLNFSELAFEKALGFLSEGAAREKLKALLEFVLERKH